MASVTKTKIISILLVLVSLIGCFLVIFKNPVNGNGNIEVDRASLNEDGYTIDVAETVLSSENQAALANALAKSFAIRGKVTKNAYLIPPCYRVRIDNCTLYIKNDGNNLIHCIVWGKKYIKAEYTLRPGEEKFSEIWSLLEY